MQGLWHHILPRLFLPAKHCCHNFAGPEQWREKSERNCPIVVIWERAFEGLRVDGRVLAYLLLAQHLSWVNVKPLAISHHNLAVDQHMRDAAGITARLSNG